MIYTPLTKKAMNVAFEAHKNQRDKGGMPYVCHLYAVADPLKSEAACCVAWLHDIVEDGHLTMEDVAAQGFPAEVLSALKVITKPDDMPYEAYVARVKENALATVVKLSDLRNNMDTSRLNAQDRDSEKTTKRIQKYRAAYKFLTGDDAPEA